MERNTVFVGLIGLVYCMHCLQPAACLHLLDFKVIQNYSDEAVNSYSKNARNLASRSFDKQGIFLIIFGKQHQHTFNRKLSYRREAARCRVLLNILVSR